MLQKMTWMTLRCSYIKLLCLSDAKVYLVCDATGCDKLPISREPGLTVGWLASVIKKMSSHGVRPSEMCLFKRLRAIWRGWYRVYGSSHCDSKVKVLYTDVRSLNGPLLRTRLCWRHCSPLKATWISTESFLCLCPYPAYLALCAMKAMSWGTPPGG